MMHSEPERAGGDVRPTTDLPYGPLPIRPDEADDARPQSSDLEPDSPSPADNGSHAAPFSEHEPAEEDSAASSELEVAPARGEADDDVHFGIAAKALGVSRKTVERMVKRGLLERGPTGAPATVSKRALVSVLEQRRRDVSHLTRATEIEEAHSASEAVATSWPESATVELQELLRPVLEPLLDEFVAARTRAALLESQIEATRSTQERTRDELLLALATGSWRQRRRARKAALRHYVLRDNLPSRPS